MKPWMAVIALGACGCSGGEKSTAKKPPEQVKNEWAPKVQAKLEKIVVAAAEASASSDTATPSPGGAKLVLDFDDGDATKHPNAIVVQLDNAGLTARPKPQDQQADMWDKLSQADAPITVPGPPRPLITFQSDHRNRVYEAKQLLGIEELGRGDELAPEWHYDQLVNAKYVLIVTPAEVEWPTTEGSDLIPGKVPFRATLFEIDTAKPLGAFESAAKSTDKVSVQYDRDHALSDMAKKSSRTT